MKRAFTAAALAGLAEQLREYAAAVKGLARAIKDLGLANLEINNVAGLDRATGLIEDFLSDGQETVRRLARKRK